MNASSQLGVLKAHRLGVNMSSLDWCEKAHQDAINKSSPVWCVQPEQEVEAPAEILLQAMRPEFWKLD